MTGLLKRNTEVALFSIPDMPNVGIAKYGRVVQIVYNGPTILVSANSYKYLFYVPQEIAPLFSVSYGIASTPNRFVGNVGIQYNDLRFFIASYIDAGFDSFCLVYLSKN